jgi:hypothetical protein
MTPSHCDVPPLAFFGGRSVLPRVVEVLVRHWPSTATLYKFTPLNLYHTSTMAPHKPPKKGKLAGSASTAAAAKKKAKRTAAAVAPDAASAAATTAATAAKSAAAPAAQRNCKVTRSVTAADATDVAVAGVAIYPDSATAAAAAAAPAGTAAVAATTGILLLLRVHPPLTSRTLTKMSLATFCTIKKYFCHSVTR